MAKPIKETPALFGKYARRFLNRVKTPSVDAAAIERAHKTYQSVKNNPLIRL